MPIQPGALVRYREREWVVLPSVDPDLWRLRPVGGSTREICGVVRSLSNLIGATLPYERVTEASFPLPTANNVQDHAAVQLLLDAARLLLRDGAAPFRALGHLSVRPRAYQLVPLIMALRLETVRLLIADDVGVGKTIEAGLIARELLDRGEVQRVAVLCPPYLCEQWQKELAEKFHIDAVVVRAGTVARLERGIPPNQSIFAHYPHLVVSIDTVKSERYRAAFLQHCPALVIVDEVHGAARPSNRSATQQQRHDLLVQLAAAPKRHLVLLSATPHSGVQDSFLSLLALLDPTFGELNLERLSNEERIVLARHFVQRRRGDVQEWSGEKTPFPERVTEGAEQPYHFSPAYRAFYEEVYTFASELVRSAESLSGWRKRMRFWSALALLRSVTSSPAAAETALKRRLTQGDRETELDLLDESTVTADELDAEFAPVIHDLADAEATVDTPPDAIFQRQEQDATWGERERRQLREFARRANGLRGAQDSKLQRVIELVRELLEAGYQPIVWCRYIATADYVAEQIRAALGRAMRDLRVVAITGALADEERRLLVADLGQANRRVLVATDCLSEGINLQEHFSAVIHYDLPWNPNRLEQREGRVDRFGQESETVKALLLFGIDNPVDGAVLDVLLRKARDIRRVLGVAVPIPVNSEQIMEAVLNSLFTGGAPVQQYQQRSLFNFIEDEQAAAAAEARVRQVHEEWTQAAEREKVSRSRFAQHAVKEEEVLQALQESDSVLGAPAQVRAFLRRTSQRLSFGLMARGVVADGIRAERWRLTVADLPESVRYRLGNVPQPWEITFDSPTPANLTYIGRNHPLIEGLAEYLLDQAFHPGGGPSPVARCGIIRTDQVKFRTTLFLLRLRYLQRERGSSSELLAEETLAWGVKGIYPDLDEMGVAESQYLLDHAQSSDNIEAWERQAILAETLSWWDDLTDPLNALVQRRAEELQTMQREVRRQLQQRMLYVQPQMPPDLLGVLVLLPML